MRRFSYYIYDRGWPFKNGTATCEKEKIGEVTLILFNRFFRRAPRKLFWRENGFMSEAVDNYGNRLEVHQWNNDEEPGFNLQSGRFEILSAFGEIDESTFVRCTNCGYIGQADLSPVFGVPIPGCPDCDCMDHMLQPLDARFSLLPACRVAPSHLVIPTPNQTKK